MLGRTFTSLIDVDFDSGSMIATHSKSNQSTEPYEGDYHLAARDSKKVFNINSFNKIDQFKQDNTHASINLIKNQNAYQIRSGCLAPDLIIIDPVVSKEEMEK